MFNVRLAGDHFWGKMAAAGDVFDGVLFFVVLFPTRCI